MTQDFKTFMAIASGRAFEEKGRGATSDDIYRHAFQMLFERVVSLEKSRTAINDAVEALEDQAKSGGIVLE